MSETPSEQEAGNALPEISGYRLLRVLGTGGMSTVYLGVQEALDREAAIKVMLPEALADEVSRRRFENEARTIARLEHPHIVGIYQVGRSGDGLPYYAMPYLPRGHLGQREFARDEAGQAQVRAVLDGLLSALEYAHARGVIHRDVKAENVLFDEAGRPLLADFGIALRRGYGSRMTGVGMAVGSTAYMAPEQARGEQVDARADLYAVGVLAWEMLTGRLPFLAGDALSMAVMHAQDPIPRLPPELRHWQRFIDHAMAKSPGKRFGSAQQMRAALARVPRHRSRGAGRILDALRGSIARSRDWPRAAWVGVLLLAAAGIGLALRELAPGEGGGFFHARETAGSDAQSAQDAAAARSRLDASASMLRPLPISPARRWIDAAQQQANAGQLIAPAGDNAYDSLVAGWRADPSNPALRTASAELLDQLGDAASTRIRSGADAGAAAHIRAAGKLAVISNLSDQPQMAALRDRVVAAYGRRIDDAVAAADRAAVSRALAAAGEVIDDATALAALQARSQATPQDEANPAIPPTMRVVGTGSSRVALSTLKVSRADYARFAAATRRPASLCRLRVSLLRILRPISWREPGFEQGSQRPVVCVSWSDASAYARWLGRRDGHRYRLPTAAEARNFNTGDGARPMSEWLRECSRGCRERMAAGRSWRESERMRALDPNRGYDDVGFRLVREL